MKGCMCFIEGNADISINGRMAWCKYSVRMVRMYRRYVRDMFDVCVQFVLVVGVFEYLSVYVLLFCLLIVCRNSSCIIP